MRGIAWVDYGLTDRLVAAAIKPATVPVPARLLCLTNVIAFAVNTN